MKRYWIKLYVELLQDDKIGPLPVWLKWRFIELLLVAAEGDGTGALPSLTRMAWRLRTSEDDLVKSLRALSEIGVVRESGDHWKVTNFEKRQSALTTTERVQAFRERKRNEDETKSYSNDNEADVYDSVSSSDSLSSDSLSSEEGEGMGEGETPAKLFTNAFGDFKGKRETARWQTIFEAVGQARAEDLIAWASKREIHLENRPSLLDSLETAAKNWTEKANGKHKRTPAEALDAYGKSQGWR